MKPEGIFYNGDLWYDEYIEEDGETFYLAYKQETSQENGHDYETSEVPERFVLFEMTVFPDGTKKSEVDEYFLAKKIGDARFGSACQHVRSKNGYCPDCLRKVI